MIAFDTFVEYVRYAKILEYLTAFIMMGLFVLFYKWVNGAETETEAAPVPSIIDWVHGLAVPKGYKFHLGHAWAQRLQNGLARIGIDDFAQKLVGDVDFVRMPAPGTMLRQGEPAFTLVVDGRPVEVLSPLDGKVVLRNESLASSGAPLAADPYEAGWLLEVQPFNWRRSNRNLLEGSMVRRWFEDSLDKLFALSSPELGLVAADGGLPTSGMAKAVDPVHWEEITKRFLMGEEENESAE